MSKHNKIDRSKFKKTIPHIVQIEKKVIGYIKSNVGEDGYCSFTYEDVGENLNESPEVILRATKNLQRKKVIKMKPDSRVIICADGEDGGKIGQNNHENYIRILLWEKEGFKDSIRRLILSNIPHDFIIKHGSDKFVFTVIQELLRRKETSIFSPHLSKDDIAQNGIALVIKNIIDEMGEDYVFDEEDFHTLAVERNDLNLLLGELFEYLKSIFSDIH